MFCSKCGNTIDDNATFCSFCGNVINGAAPSAPVGAAPQQPAPQQQAPQYGAQQGQYGYAPAPTLSPAMINMINMIIKGVLAILAVLVLIGAIGTLGTIGAIKSASTNLFNYDYSKVMKLAQNLVNFIGLARVPAIIAFSFTLVDVVFVVFTKRKSMLTYINAGIGVILFTFNFVMYGNMMSMMNADNATEAGITVAAVFLLIGSVALLASTLLTLLKKEYLLFGSRPQNPPMPPTPPSYPPYQQ